MRLNKKNFLNDLQGKDWIKFTKSWFVINPPARNKKIIHPASFPEDLAMEFITFFTKKNQWVLDPFAGTGSTLVAAKLSNRNAIGIELYQKYANLARRRVQRCNLSHSKAFVFTYDSRKITELLTKVKLPKMDFCLCSPPYWSQLNRNSERQQTRKQNGFATRYGKNANDLGRIESYEDFLVEQEKVFDGVYEVMKNRGYLVVITNNVYSKSRLYPLAFDTMRILSKKWVPKDEKIWCQDNKELFPFGMTKAWVGNRCHHYCLIFRKEQ